MASEPEVIYDFDPRNLPPEMLRAIGLVAAASSQTEHVVQSLIGGLLGIDNIETLALTTHMAAPLKDHVVRALAELSAPSPAQLDQIDDLMDAVNDAFDKRNLIVHNAIARHPVTGECFSYRQKARGSLQLSLIPVTAEEFARDAALIYEAGMDLMRFMISRGIGPRERIRPIRAALDRRKKAREKRRDGGVRDTNP